MVQIWSRSRENTIILKQTLQIYKVSVHPFEVGSHTRNITRENKERITRLHKLCKREVKFKTFKNNISAIAILGSYYIFNNRNVETWHAPIFYTYWRETIPCLQEDLCVHHTLTFFWGFCTSLLDCFIYQTIKMIVYNLIKIVQI